MINPQDPPQPTKIATHTKKVNYERHQHPYVGPNKVTKPD